MSLCAVISATQNGPMTSYAELRTKMLRRLYLMFYTIDRQMSDKDTNICYSVKIVICLFRYFSFYFIPCHPKFMLICEMNS